MNAGPADTRSPHLDLEELIAGAAGQPVADRSREHLTHCGHCRTEANRWGLVAGGVRSLAADLPQAADPPQAAQPARPRRTRQRGPAGPWRRATLVAGSVAAALVLLLGIGAATGYVHVHFSGPSTSGPSTDTALTAVTGCSQLEQAKGTLVQLNGTSLVIKTASGQPVTVTTTASTFVSMSGPLLSAITDGASVMVRGDSSGGTIAAAIVTVGQPFKAVNPAGYVPVQGTVADASTAGFTLVTSGGSRIKVTTSDGTLVIVPHASLGQLQDGTTIFGVGHAGPDGTLRAQAVAAVSQLRVGPRLNVSSRGCSPAAVTALAAGLGG